MPDVSGASAVNTRAHTSLPLARTRLRAHWAPGIPRALGANEGRTTASPRGAHGLRARSLVDRLKKANHTVMIVPADRDLERVNLWRWWGSNVAYSRRLAPSSKPGVLASGLLTKKSWSGRLDFQSANAMQE